MNAKVDAYIERSDRWPAEIAELRAVLRGGGLAEELKWGKPCYCHDGKNIAILQEMSEFLALMFFKGALLADADDVLEEQGPNSRSARRICFRSVDDVRSLAATVTAYVAEAIDVEEAGLEVGPAPPPELAPELQRRLSGDGELRTAFDALTPGRRREYNLDISAAKKSETRESRIDRHTPKILAGKGMRDR